MLELFGPKVNFWYILQQKVVILWNSNFNTNLQVFGFSIGLVTWKHLICAQLWGFGMDSFGSIYLEQIQVFMAEFFGICCSVKEAAGCPGRWRSCHLKGLTIRVRICTKNPSSGWRRAAKYRENKSSQSEGSVNTLMTFPPSRCVFVALW